jgi:hypothetical protein
MIRHTRTGSGGTTSLRHYAREESRFPRILFISHIAEIQAEFTNTLIS